MEALKNLFSFNRLTERTEFWIVAIAIAVLNSIVTSFSAGLSIEVINGTLTAIEYAPNPIVIPYIIAIAWIKIALYKTRLNDAGWSGWWMLFPILNIVVAGFFKSSDTPITKETK